MPEANRSGRGLDSKWFTRHATWSGLVFALAAVLTALNLFPPSDLYYLVRSEVVVSATRLPQLKSLLERKRAGSDFENSEQPVCLIDLQVLDHTERMLPGPMDAESVALVAMNSRWRDRCTPPTHRQWLKSVTRLEKEELDSSEIARQHRFASWALSAARHYADRHDFLASRQPAATSSDGRSFQLVTGSSAPVTLAGFGGARQVDDQEPRTEQERQRLLDEVRQSQQRLDQAKQAWTEKVDRAHGLVRLATQPRITVRSTFIPTWLLASVLSLGLFAGAIAAWLQNRLHSGGVFEPADVANQLALQGLPVVGALSVPESSVELDDWLEKSSRLAAGIGRRAARNMTLFSEVVIGGWMMMIAIRLVLDPLWRALLIDNPLAAFSRLLLGMP